MPTIGQTRPSTKQRESEEIERLTREYLRKGGTVDQADLRETKHVDLTFRHYSKAAMEDAR